MKRRHLASALIAIAITLAAMSAGATTWGPDGFGYTVNDETALVWEDISGTGTAMSADSDDSDYGDFPIGFTFNFYGVDYTDFYASTNGYVNFVSDTNRPENFGFEYPYKDEWIGAMGGDRAVYADQDGEIYYETLGSAPNRRLVVQWVNASLYYYLEEPLYDASDLKLSTYEIILYEGTNNIAVLYDELELEPVAAFVGIQSTAANSWLTPTDIDQVFVSTDQGFLFSPSADPAVTVVDSFAGRAAPDSTYTHTLRIFNTTGANDTFDVTVTEGEWSATLSDDTIAINDGESADVTVEVEVPADAGIGDADSFTIEVAPQAKAASRGSRVVTTTVTPDPVRVEDAPDYFDSRSLVAYDGMFYVFGGDDASGDAIFTYDPDADTWDTLSATLPEARTNHAVAVYDGNAILFGGNDTTDVKIYDIDGDSWSDGEAMPAARDGLAVAAVGDLVYVCGGYDDLNNDTATLWVYDAAEDNWDELTDMPGTRTYHDMVAIDGKLYVAGGYDEDHDEPALEIYVYDIAGDSWDTLDSPIDHSRVEFAAFTDGRVMYLTGGENFNYIGHNFISVYDPATDEWSWYPGVSRRDHYYAQAAYMDGRALLAGGDSYSDFQDDEMVELLTLCGVPAPDFSADATEIEAGGSVTFTSDDSGSGFCNYLTFAWDFGDGETGDTDAIAHTYADAGTYTVTLTVTTTGGEGIAEKIDYITVTGGGDDDTDDDTDDDSGDDDASGDDDTAPMDDDGGDDDDDDDGGCCGC